MSIHQDKFSLSSAYEVKVDLQKYRPIVNNYFSLVDDSVSV